MQEQCQKCGRGHFHRVCPVQWPIDTIGIACSTCGAICGYADRQLLIGAKDATTGFERRGFVRSHTAYRKVQEGVGSESMILMGLRNGLDAVDVSETLGIAIDAVIEIAKRNGLYA